MMPETYTKFNDNVTMESRYFLFQPVKVQIKFAKYILRVNKTAPNLAVLGELGMIPCSVDAIKLCGLVCLNIVFCKCKIMLF
jgi:hypothetical protein